MIDDLFAVVLAGGSGTRFWPASRRLMPKQLLAIGPEPDSLIAATVRRIESLVPAERTLIATGVHLLDETRRVLSWLPSAAFLGEPIAKNTAPCIAWASWEVVRRNPNGVVMVLPSDQHVGDPQAFLDAVRRAVESSARGPITTIGLLPTRPDTGYGYIEAGAESSPGVRDVARFVEKPDRARAEEYALRAVATTGTAACSSSAPTSCKRPFASTCSRWRLVDRVFSLPPPNARTGHRGRSSSARPSASTTA
ncbi:MAG: sugar phosphate nucleotidyltransferase [Polyangiaceae bacterium]